MKIDARRLAGFLAKPDPGIRAVLVYGPDEGLVRERGEALARSVVPDLADPFRVADLRGDDLAKDPARLADEAAAIPLGGGRRVVRIRPAGKELATALKQFLGAPAGDALIVIEAGELEARAPLRRLAEAADNAAAIACYHDEGKALERVIAEELARHRLTPEPDALAWLAQHLGSDRQVTRRELEKLALYVGAGGKVTLADAEAMVGDSAERDAFDLAHAVAQGEATAAERILGKLWAEGAQPVMVLRILARHFLRLHEAAGHMAQGRDAAGAIAALRPPVFWRDPPRMTAALRRWPAAKLGAAIDLLLKVEQDCKSTGRPAVLLTERAVYALTRQARG